MAMVNVVYWLPRGGLMAQADWLGPNVGGHWRCFGIHRVNRVNCRSALSTTTASTLLKASSRNDEFQAILTSIASLVCLTDKTEN